MKNYTHIIIILDRSGSMGKIRGDVLGGFNTFLNEQKQVPGDATLTLVQFSDKYQITYADVPLKHVAELTNETYSPSGGTSLNDALGKTINDVGALLAAKNEEDRPSKVVLVVMTDGEENTSKEFIGAAGLSKLKEMVKHQTEQYSWSFSFLGANIDSFIVADAFGVKAGNVINYAANNVGSFNAFKTLSRGMTTARMKGGEFFSYDAGVRQVSDSTLDTTNIAEVINKYQENK